MTRPVAPTRIMLIEDKRGELAGAGAASVRRYRIARLSVGGAPSSDGEKRFEYLKRSHD